MENMGDAIMGTGIAHGEERAILAAQQAINSPLLQSASINGAKGLLVNITGPEEMTIHELNDASSIIYEESGEDANVILGCVIDPELSDEINVTVIATGLNYEEYPNFYRDETKYSKKKLIQKGNTKNEDKINLEGDNNQNISLKKNEIEKNDSSVKKERDNNVTIFGEDLDIPAYLRDKNS